MKAQRVLDSRKTLPVSPLPIDMKEAEGGRGVIGLASIKKLRGRKDLLERYR